MPIKRVGDMPKAKRGAGSAEPLFTQDEIDEMKADPKAAYEVATNISSAQRYAAFCKSEAGKGFIYRALDSGKTRKGKKNGKAADLPTYNVFMAYDPEKADEREASRKAAAAKS